MFLDLFKSYNWDETKDSIYRTKASDVEKVIQKARSETLSLSDFKTLISPAASPFLEEMARLSQEKTIKRFGRIIQLYIPMYLSNECQNICTYCGFSFENKIERITLNDEQILNEVAVIKEMGYDHILLVTGEANQRVGLDYFKHVLKLIRPYFSNISLEVQPLSEADYKTLSEYGLNTVLVYQESYHQAEYKKHHPKGKKSNFEYRLETPDRLAKSEIHKIGLGCLLGLEDWRTDSFFTALHLNYLEQRYWKSKYSLSFPRLRPYEGCLKPKVEMNDRDLLQLICAYRLFNEELELSLSTRESPHFRNHAFKLGITTMSAGSKTNPGAYSGTNDELKQFEISDERSAKEIAEMIRKNNYETVWKDWDQVLQES